MKTSVTLIDISKRAGVSSATVSRVVNGSPLVVEATRLRVQKVIEELGYRPNFAARMLIRDRTEIIAVIIPSIGKYYFSDIMAAADRVASAQAYHVMVALSHGAVDEQDVILRYVLERRADGLIIMALSAGCEAAIKQAGRSGVPISVIGRPVKGKGLFSVGIDNRSGARQAIEHLVKRGFQRVALLTGPAENFDSQERLAGARRAAAQAGLRLRPDWIWTGDFEGESGYRWAKQQFSKGGPQPDAVFAFNDGMALGARAALQELGLRIPQDVGLVGFDDVDAAFHAGLTTVKNPTQELGRLAAEALMSRLQGKSPPALSRVLPTSLIARASTAR